MDVLEPVHCNVALYKLWKYAEDYHVCIYICTSLYVCAYACILYVHICTDLCVWCMWYKDSKILCWLYSVILLSWVSVRGGWLDSLVLDNCTLPRSVVPFSVSLWPRLQEPYLGCTSSSSYPVSSPSCSAHPHNTVGGRWSDSKWFRGQTVGVLANCAKLLQGCTIRPVLWT